MRRRYLLLGALLAIAVVSQATYTADVVRYLAGTYPQRPFNIDAPWPTISWVHGSGSVAGLAVGDRVVSVDGKPQLGYGDLPRAVRERRPGDALEVVTERNGNSERHTVKLVPVFRYMGPAPGVLTWLVMPWLCIGLGFWVAGIRPLDSRAWMLLGLLLGLAYLPRTDILDVRGWPAPLAVPMVAYRELAIRTWAIGMALFGLYFPHRWNVEQRAPWVKWLLIIPLAAGGILGAIFSGAAVVNYGLAEHISLPIPESFQVALMLIGGSAFFVPISMKYHDPGLACDDRRRLKLLYWGCTAAMTPAGIIWMRAIFFPRATPPPDFLAAICLAMMGLFPLTMAYVIVVERAMDVRMVIRQGVQYALARRGIRVIQAALIIFVVFAAATLIGDKRVSTPQRFTLIALGTALALRVRDLGERVRRWVDKRFFREAYNAEQILSDLSEQVRSILDRDALLETVARKLGESLHVERIAVMLRDGAVFRPALATGYAPPLDMAVPETSPAVDALVHSADPVPGDAIERLGAQLLLPLASHKRLLGFIGLGPKKSEEPYTPSDTSLLRSVAVQTGLALENARLSEEIAAEVAQRELLNREIEIAREVQQRLFPQTLPEIPALEYAGHCRPARGVGGDYYDFLALSSGRLGIAIGDVSGKGIPAALLMASLQASVRGQSQAGTLDVAALIGNVNRLVCDATPENRYATFFYGLFDPSSLCLVYTNAGHNPPIVLRGDDVIRLECGGPPVGLFRFSQYRQAEVQLLSGDLLLLFTDGISEAENPREEEWGEEALIAAARECDGVPPQSAIERLMHAADTFAAGAPQHDDMTLVVARVLG